MNTDNDSNICRKIINLVQTGQRLFNLLTIVQADIEEFKTILREIVIDSGSDVDRR